MSESATSAAVLPEKSDHRTTIVMVAGGATSLVALGAVYALVHAEVNVMGWYVNGIIPAGAILVGLLAASGYAVAAWWVGLRMTKPLIWSVVGQLTLAYLVAQYEEYLYAIPDGRIGFFEYYDLWTRSFAFSDSSGKRGEALGVLGYGLRLLEVVGFVAGGAWGPIILRAKPYCDACRAYKKERTHFRLVAGVPFKMLGRFDKDEHAKQQQAALDGLPSVFTAAASGDRRQLDQAVAALPDAGTARKAMKLSGHVVVETVRCPRCAAGTLRAALIQGQGKNTTRTPLAEQEVDPRTMRSLFDAPAASAPASLA